ncbi:YfaZ family outer membrane protein [Enterobacter roggenkampii]
MRIKLITFFIPMMLSMQTFALGIEIGGGDKFQYLNAGLGSPGSPGFSLQANVIRSEDNGTVTGPVIGFGIPLGPIVFTPGSRLAYLKPDNSKKSYVAAPGVNINIELNDDMSIFGEYWYSPNELSDGVENYQEAAAGVRYNVIRPLSISMGYRFSKIKGQDGRADSVLADGVYLGGAIYF